MINEFTLHTHGRAFAEKYKIDKNESIFRFYDIQKFISLITEKSIYFSSQNHFDDHLEGGISPYLRKFFNGIAETNVDIAEKNQERIKKYNAISCWKCGTENNNAMWLVYTNKIGVAIETNIDLLAKSIDAENQEILYGKVIYTAENTAMNPYLKGIPPMDYREYLIPTYWKSDQYKFESEMRLLINEKEMKIENDGIIPERAAPYTASIKLNDLFFIKAIHLSPFLEPWGISATEKLIEKFDIKCKIHKQKKLANFQAFNKLKTE
jgi:hypothetical protein